jgi:hypothetical protein
VAQHKGKEFNEPFYRKIILASVLWFLQLKDEMDNYVSLEKRSKKQTKPHLQDELMAAMTLLHKHEINKCCPGRLYGFKAKENFLARFSTLLVSKLKSFIPRATMHMDQTGTAGRTATDATAVPGNTSDKVKDYENNHLLNGSEPLCAPCLQDSELCL